MKITIRQLRRVIREELENDGESKLAPNKKNDTVQLAAGDEIAKRIEDDIFDMITHSYAKIGGNATISSPADLGQYPEWYVSDIDEDPEADVAVLGKQKSGNLKIAASATDGTSAAKEKANKIKQQLYNGGAWSEASDAVAHIAIRKLGIPTVKDEQRARELLGKDIEWHGEHPNDPDGRWRGTFGWYTRDIGGHPHTKIIVGNV